MASLLQNGEQQFLDNNGNPLVAGTVDFYIPATTTRKDTWQDSSLTVLNANPVILNAGGRAVIWGAGSYRQVVKDQFGNLIWDRNVTDYNSTVLTQVNTISALRNISKAIFTNVFVNGYYSVGDGGGGSYYYDASDTTSADNGGTIIVATDGGRWKLQVISSVTVKQFGAKGASTDDTIAIQNALNWIGSVRGLSLIFPAGKYNISSQLIFRATSVLPPAFTGSDIHFSEHVESVIKNEGDARIIATASMTSMLLLQYNSPITAIGPFYTTVQGLLFDGANLANAGISSDYTMNVSILKNKIWHVMEGIKFTGYGVAKIRDNVIKASFNCINFSGGGGDSEIEANDLYPMTGAVGVRVGALGGDATINDNKFNGEGNTGCIGVYLDGVAAGPSGSVINVNILTNEFSGMAIPIYAQRYSSVRNIWGIIIENNHTIPAAGGAVHTGTLGSLVGVDTFTIANNHINSTSLAANITGDPGINLSDCTNFQIHDNKFGNLLSSAVYFINCSNGMFMNNKLDNVGQSGSTMVEIDTGTNSVVFADNVLRQTNGAYAQIPFLERSGANSNEYLRNHIFGCSSRPTIVGAASVSSGRVVAQGSYSLGSGSAVLQPNSSGFSVNRTGVGVCVVTLATARIDSNYRVKVASDSPQVSSDTYTNNSFTVRTFTGAGALTDATHVQIEVVD